jgi:FkbM family methyltransferase
MVFFEATKDVHTTSCGPDSAPLWASLLAKISRRLPAGKYRIIGWLRRSYSKPFVATMPQELGGYKFHCVTHDNVASRVFFAGCYEPQESAFARSVLRPGMSFVDVGANWGFFTLMAAHLVGTTGRVVSLEPDPRAFLKLKANIERNRLEQVRIFELAATDRNGDWILALQDETVLHLGTSRLIQNESAAPATCAVRSRPLDSLLDEAGVDGVDLIKIDVEGAEDMVLAGMEAGLERHRYRSLILELHPPQLAERKRTISEVVQALLGQGYRGFGLDHSPVTQRRAGYHPRLHVREFIQPLKEALADPWPHTVWLSPGQADVT